MIATVRARPGGRQQTPSPSCVRTCTTSTGRSPPPAGKLFHEDETRLMDLVDPVGDIGQRQLDHPRIAVRCGAALRHVDHRDWQAAVPSDTREVPRPAAGSDETRDRAILLWLDRWLAYARVRDGTYRERDMSSEYIDDYAYTLYGHNGSNTTFVDVLGCAAALPVPDLRSHLTAYLAHQLEPSRRPPAQPATAAAPRPDRRTAPALQRGLHRATPYPCARRR